MRINMPVRKSFTSVCELIDNDKVEFAAMAIENSIAGSLLNNYQLIRDYHLKIIGEIYIHIQMNLMSWEGVSKSDITDIHSHPANWKMTLNEAEATRMNQGRRMFKKKGGDAMRFSPRRFSKDDYSFGPGYLVYDDELWHQAGKGTERILWTLPEELSPASP